MSASSSRSRIHSTLCSLNIIEFFSKYGSGDPCPGLINRLDDAVLLPVYSG